MYYVAAALKLTVPVISTLTHRHDFLVCLISDVPCHCQSSCMVIIALYLTLVSVPGASPDSLTWLSSLTLDFPHHCGGDLNCWVNLVTVTGLHLLILLGYGGAACPSNGKPLPLPALLPFSAPSFSSSAEHPALAAP